jgi:chromosome segregation ATPase
MRRDKEIKELIAGFEAPIRRTNSVIASMRNKLVKSKLKGDKYSEALSKIDDVESLVFYATQLKMEINECNEQVSKAYFHCADLEQKYKDKCEDLHRLELISEMGWEEYKGKVKGFYEAEIYPHFPKDS